jgi:hypothetical protein
MTHPEIWVSQLTLTIGNGLSRHAIPPAHELRHKLHCNLFLVITESSPVGISVNLFVREFVRARKYKVNRFCLIPDRLPCRDHFRVMDCGSICHNPSGGNIPDRVTTRGSGHRATKLNLCPTLRIPSITNLIHHRHGNAS